MRNPKHSRIEADKATIQLMIGLYCRHKLGKKVLPDDLQRLSDYACKRLERCRWGEQKPNCHYCPVHCYAPKERELMRQVMRWTGPRMLLYVPREALRYLVRKIIKVDSQK
ncbi:MAG: nitrous oxide-stimulated promoter family protein [Prevotella sp.]|nr:nitrous oxide-stimulated promoter family protein [Prevotella sp.]